ncbi:antibiotic biosynthesis monooxygenase family protein [Mesorhizobium sp. BAC0120]|uniref:antibiotic biosynthesis monooxygenase family protein n=1 Tax=Mesorhizobium sp. BAC0120 TaxID=3090670 RepID=UPI00298D4461|nr:antibiotic biosynthesis monooxygenase family protein [Mesorhizobium sp. BAC0120]MDW6023936.1 antibiotic biosynthesis monooxygenase family protein [Mesorhizobium sp. BAC0120]
MNAYAIIVDFELKPGAQQAFRRLVDENARASVENERGCRRFDVLEPRDATDRVLLYEIYEDEAAFADHLNSLHYERFDRESASLVSQKSVTQCDLVCNGLPANTSEGKPVGYDRRE